MEERQQDPAQASASGTAVELNPPSIQASALVRSIGSLSSIFWISFGGGFLSVFFAGLSQLEINATTDYIFLGEYQVPKSILPLVSVAFAGFVFWLTANRLNMLHYVLRTTRLPSAMVHEIFRLNPPVLHVFDADSVKRWALTTGVSVFVINWAVFFGNNIALTWSSAIQQGASAADFDAPMLFLYLLFTILVLVYGIRAIVPSLGRILLILHGLHFKVGWPRYAMAVMLMVLVFIANHWNQIRSPMEQADSLLGPSVANAIDGETLFLKGVEVQLFGIDAVEADQVCQDANGKDYPCGRRATHALQTLLQRGPAVCFPLFTVNVLRVVAECVVDDGVASLPTTPRQFMRRDHPRNLSRLMIAQGHALGVGLGRGYFSADQDQAQQQRVGIWQGSFQPPSSWRRR